MTKVVFETATIADSIKKAERIAPDKGLAFDKAAGIVVEVYPQDEAVVVRATNLDVYYMEWVDSLEISGDRVSWRFPSRVFAAFIASLPIGSGRSVTLEAVGPMVRISSGRAVANLNTMDIEYYPTWYQFSEDGMVTIPELGGRIAQVEWAASKSDVALGLRFTGEHVLANDRQKLAAAPLVLAGLSEPFTIPPNTLSGIIRERGDNKVKLEDGVFMIMPDDHTQIRTVVIGEKYPPAERIMSQVNQPETITFRKQDVIDMINRTMKIAAADRFPSLKVIIGREEIAAVMQDDEKGLIGDVISLAGQAIHKRINYFFLPENLLAALSNAPSEEVKMSYTPDNNRLLVYIDGGSGYQAWVAPRADQSPIKQGE